MTDSTSARELAERIAETYTLGPDGGATRLQKAISLIALYSRERDAALFEEMEEIVGGELGDWGGPERALLSGRLDEILKQFRAACARDSHE